MELLIWMPTDRYEFLHNTSRDHCTLQSDGHVTDKASKGLLW